MSEPESPREKGPRERRPRGILTILLVVAMGAMILFVFGEGEGGAEELGWIDFNRRLSKGEVDTLTVLRDEWVLTGTWKAKGPDGQEESFRVGLPHPEILDNDYIENHIKPNVGEFRTKDPSRFWAYLLPAIPWVILIGLFWFLYMRQSRASGGQAGMLSFGKSRARLHRSEHSTVTFEDVAGIEEAKEEVGEIIAFLKNPVRFQRLGGRVPKGVLLVGAPGTGKTLLAKAISGEADVPFFSISGSDFVEMFVGVGASRVRDLFKQARESSPCIIFLDEIDAVGRRRGAGVGGGHDEREQTLNAILVEMDGFETDVGIIILASTNRPDILDPALLRPGRFDRQVVVDMPDLKGRLAILEVHGRDVKLDPDVDLHLIARGTPSFSGADLAAVVNEAALLATMKDKDSVELDDLEEARDKVRWGRQKHSRVLELEDRKITACHESGHALVALFEADAEPLHKVTIIPRGMALGATMQLPERDRYHMQKGRLLAMITVLFGGRVAEEMFCDDITSGAQNDIERATEIARRMVTEWGMSERIGPIHYREGKEHVFLGHDVMNQRHHSEKTAMEIDEEVRRIVEECHERARTLLDGHRAEMESLKDALIRYEVLTGAEVEAVLDGETVEAHRRSVEEKRKAGSKGGTKAAEGDSPADDDLPAEGFRVLRASEPKQGGPMPRAIVRVIDHHSFPEFARTLDRARASVTTEHRAAALDASRVLALVVSGLTDAEGLLVAHQAEAQGLSTVPLAAERKGEATLAVLGTFAAVLATADRLGSESGSFPELARELRGAICRYREPQFTVPLAGGGSLELGGRTLVMGILNVTPDSFSDGGEFTDPDLAVERAHRMVEEGADIVDVGGESTRPGAEPVDADEERRRILPVIEAIAMGLDVPVSVDTRRGGVARDALLAGAKMVNDVSGLTDPLTPAVAARAGAPVVIMHMRGTPEDMATKTDYRDVTADVVSELSVSVGRAIEAGLPEESILVDPGIGFAKTAEQSRELIRRLPELRTLGRPIVVGPSRKSFLATVRDVPPPERVHLTLGAVTACVARGAHIVRVHDVRAATDAVRAFEACVRA